MTPQDDFLNVSYDSTLAQPAADAVQQYPVVQWSNDPAAPGWLAPCDRLEEYNAVLPWPKRVVRLGANDVLCYHSTSAEVLILAQTKRWFVKGEDGRDRYLDGYQEGARSRTHLLAIVWDQVENERNTDTPPDLFVMSFKGSASADFTAAQGKLTAAMKRANALRPTYFFRLRLSAGTPKRLTQGATVAPLLLEQPGKTDDVVAWLRQRFVGADFVAEVEARYADDIRDFLKPRTNGDTKGDEGNGNASHDDPHAAQQPAPLPATGPAPASTTTTTSTAPWSSDAFDTMPSATGDRDVAMGLAKNWKSADDAIKWALGLGAFANLEEAQADYWWLYGDAKAKRGAPPPMDSWSAQWIDAVLAMVDTTEEVGF